MDFAVGPVISSDYHGELFPLKEWLLYIKTGQYNKYDGYGCWVQGIRFMTTEIFGDDVFSTPPPGATHVMWYNK